ncbi:uncharacterized membrane protein YuiD-like isoform X3 [Phoenix dactylifera]|uniref:Uncharacterized membrane protein YuiD-like isoform X3 n=1 Tax=Phoenix dactylifera TaxID=42345 RepID=A0A8B9AUM8_PHODC|nr:uncharacterized membrane protein YuiD-like isoform X3 [Phoenix dactylifera]
MCGNDLLCCGGSGMMLMSTTAVLSKALVSPFFVDAGREPDVRVGGLWRGTIKMFLNFSVERRWDYGMLFSSGGMPSSHSALCMALTASVGLCHGAADSLFPVCLGFSLIVMYDAIGVRRHAGMQVEVLNKIIEDLFQGHPISERKLKELLACVCCQEYAIAV